VYNSNMRIPMVAMVLVLGAGTTGADVPIPDARVGLVEAINKRNVDAVANLVDLPLRVRNVRFDAPECAKFSTANVERADLEQLVGCLADLGITTLAGADDRWVSALYGPGMPLVLVGSGGLRIGTIVGYQTKSHDIITIEPVTFTSHIKKFTREVAPAAALKKTIDGSPSEVATASLLVCVDAKGKVEALATTDAKTPATYAEDVQQAATKWSIQPFELGGKPIRACAKLAVGYPASRLTTPLQMQSPMSAQNIPPTMLETNRIAGPS
jgi:hypothetical protein